MKIIKIMVVFLLITNKPSFSNSSVDILKNDISAEAISLSGSNSVTSTDIFALNYNPAGISNISDYQIGISYSNGFEDSKYSFLGFSLPLKQKVLSEFSYPTLAFSIYTADLGDMTYRKINNDGSVSEERISTEKDIILTIGYGEKVYREKGIYLWEGMKSDFESSIGIGIKFINSKLLGYSANTMAVDAGYFATLKDVGIDFGVSLLNTIGKIKYIDEKNNLPSILKAGISYSKPTIMEQKLKLSLEYDNYLTDNKSSLKTGLEYEIEDIFAFRAGYRFIEDNKGLSIGVGLFTRNINFDIATVFYDVYKYTSFSIKYSFGQNQQDKTEDSKPLKKLKEKEKKTIQKNNTQQPAPSRKTIIIF